MQGNWKNEPMWTHIQYVLNNNDPRTMTSKIEKIESSNTFSIATYIFNFMNTVKSNLLLYFSMCVFGLNELINENAKNRIF